MNDSEFETNSKGKQKSLDDADTCRICRGEGSREEPLFYPCKCSGSIKFVHQNCLMEWLSHSQKKHCELCKTPFRFTKLYHPHMPSSVPLPVFFRRAAVHTWKTFLTWSRFHLVLFVWVAWLPWCMRAVWRGLFWIGDGGWTDWQKMEEEALSVAQIRLDTAIIEGTSPASAVISSSNIASTPAVVSQIANALPQLLSPISHTLNLSGRDPSLVRIIKRLIEGMVGRKNSEGNSFTTTSPVNNTNFSNPSQRSTWLSDFQFLKYLTRSSALNNLLIDTLEGQLITLSVVIAFILVFLIREWVVQQQPNLNVGAGPNGNPAFAQGRDIPVLERIARQRAEQRLQPPGEGDVATDEAQHELGGERARALRVPAGPMNQPVSPDQVILNRDHIPASNLATQEHSLRLSQTVNTSLQHDISAESEQRLPRTSAASYLSSSQRPHMPTRNTMATAAEFRRTLEEHAGASTHNDWPGLKVFMELWNRAESSPKEVVRIIEQEGRNEELGWIVTAMKKLDKNAEAESFHGFEIYATEHDTLAKTEDGTAFASGDSTSQRLISSEKAAKTVEHERNQANLHRNDARHNTEAENVHTIAGGEDTTFQCSTSTSRLGARNVQDETNDTNRNFRAHSLGQIESKSFSPDGIENKEHQESSAMASSSSANVFELPGNTEHRAENVAIPTIEEDNVPPEDSLPNHQEDSSANQNLSDKVIDWLWGGVGSPVSPAEANNQQGVDDEHIVNNFADEAPFVPMENGHAVIEEVGSHSGNDAENDDHAEHAENAENTGNADPTLEPANDQDPEAMAAAVQAGLDPNGADGADDGEDMEGIMELVGMQGPLAALIQNGMFCAILVSMTVFLGMWIPYISGKLFLVLLANPISLLFKLPLRWASIGADLMIDLGVFGAGCAFFWIDTIIRILCAPIGWIIPPIGKISQNRFLAETARSYAESAMERLTKSFVATGSSLAESDIPMFSIIAHESLRLVQHRLDLFLELIHGVIVAVLNIFSSRDFSWEKIHRWSDPEVGTNIREISGSVAVGFSKVLSLTSAIFKINPLRVRLTIPQRTTSLDFSLAYWDTKDRVLAIGFGYIFFSVLGILYLKISASFRGRNGGGKVEGALADLLYQAGGVMKVILIISIEMIVFPLYCGLLLDVALLPLFGNVTIMSRLNFLLSSPNTSLFVHWFVGTCYMFHFALFVSMCRKIMRSGVLCEFIPYAAGSNPNCFSDFIRDPDDPTFHPVRDVLERSVSTQLRKIAFSALVYGALVILCLGGVVWGIHLSFENLFPIHWSSNEPVLEFPVDLLFYNFLMPLAVRFFKPSVGLNKMYGWWFRKCARLLRLSHFLFGTKEEDEEGYSVRRSWKDWLLRKQGDFANPVRGIERRLLSDNGENQVYFVRDGCYVRAPSSDQVRIPKGVNTFLEVTEQGSRVDGSPDSDQGLHGSHNESFTTVYIPPYFRIRISLFILLIWVFAAATGISLTIIPLAVGRLIFVILIPNHLRMNDIYAFSIGLYLLGGAGYSILHYRTILDFLRASLTPRSNSSAAFLLRRTGTYGIRLLRLLYTYFSFAFLLPALFSLLIEFYIVIPLHTYFGAPSDRHIIHFIQDWTLGVLYVKMLGRLILWNTPSRAATALRAIVRHGWLDPDIHLATRGFIFPATVLMTVALTAPLAAGWAVTNLFFAGVDHALRSHIYRYSYPVLLALSLLALAMYGLGVAFQRWRQRIRDEVYLIGERLHNFGERKATGKGIRGKRVVTSQP